MQTARQLTALLGEWSRGDDHAGADVMALVYDELRKVARVHLRLERPDHTLQPTALVHETYLRMIGTDAPANCETRAQFFGIAARAMRRILVEHARARNADKRGGLHQKVPLSEARWVPQSRELDLVALDGALETFRASYPRQSRVVELKFFGGLDFKQIAELLTVSEKTILRDWSFAKLWLCRELQLDGNAQPTAS
ncbi:MAG: RNA polymerase subunit sigma-70 [Verrucomicrobia bacterium]|nr:RNA polymerase subunit sigma-70 [Verrucomicrobiota bacterium]